MIYKLFKNLGLFIAGWFYYTMASPLVVIAIICSLISISFMRTRDLQIILKDETWRSKPLRWVNKLSWPNSYLAVLEKITGYYP